MVGILLWFLASAHAQDIPTYNMTRIVVTPEEKDFGLEPDAIIEIPEEAPGRASTLDEAIKSATGLVVAKSGGSGQTSSVFFRGSGSEHTLVLLDGVEINDPSSPVGAFDFSTLDMNLVERIEIYKGPQALRFGSGALGGVINVVTKRGHGPMRVTGSVRGGSFQTHSENVAILGGSERSHYAFSLNHFETGGISAAEEGGEADAHRLWAAALRTGFALSDSLDVEFIARGAMGYSELDFASSSSPPNYMVADDPNYHVKSIHATEALHVTKVWSENVRSRLALGYDYTDRRYRDAADDVNPDTFRDDRWAGTIKGEFITSWRLNERDLITTGPTYRRENTERDAELLGAFVDWNHTRSNFFADAGIRLDSHSQFGTQVTEQIAPGFQWRGHIFKARFATAFKAPSLFQIYDPSFGNRDLTPERVRGAEFSIQKALGIHSVGVSVFRYEYRDLIQFSSRYENLGAARAQGAELEFTSGGDTRLELAYTYTDARSLSTGRQLLRRPFHTWRAGLSREFSEKLGARAMYYGVGRRSDIEALTAASTETGAYDVLDVSVTYALNAKLKATLSVENALDKEYQQVSGYGTPGAAFYLGLTGEI